MGSTAFSGRKVLASCFFDLRLKMDLTDDAKVLRMHKLD